MKKSKLFLGITYLISGIVSLIFAIMSNNDSVSGLLSGLAGAGIVPGIALIWNYIYWSRPKNKEKYEEIMKKEKINLLDERNERIRDKSGRETNKIMFMILLILLIIFMGLRILEIFMPFSKQVIILLSGLMIFQIICEIVIYRKISKEI